MSTAFTRTGRDAGFALALTGVFLASTLAYAQTAKKAPPVADPAVTANPAKVKTVINEQSGAEAAAKAAQDKINGIDDRTKDVVADYRATLQETASLKRYNEQLALQIKSQETEMVTMAQELVQIERTSREIVPLLQKMLETIDTFVGLDMPFLTDERKKRVATLKDMMKRADVSLSEKYRRIVEAYQVEMEYGRTLESYTGKIAEKSVEFLRVGRVALLYQNLDGSDTGYWDAQKKEFVEDNDYRDTIRSGLKVAKKQSAPDLLIVPISAPQEIK